MALKILNSIDISYSPTDPPTGSPPITTTTTRCPNECEDGIPETSPNIPSVTPPRSDECKSGEEDIDRPIVTTPIPIC